jgi:hypothetical protein
VEATRDFQANSNVFLVSPVTPTIHRASKELQTEQLALADQFHRARNDPGVPIMKHFASFYVLEQEAAAMLEGGQIK